MDKLLECKKIYEQAFSSDDSEFEGLLFEKCFKYVKTVEQDGEVFAMLFALPCILKLESQSFNAVYIYAAATREDKRGKGYMRTLIDGVISEQNAVVFLRPANDGLIAFYEKLGFWTVPAIKAENAFSEILPAKEFAELAQTLDIEADNSTYTAMYHKSATCKLDGLNFIYTME